MARYVQKGAGMTDNRGSMGTQGLSKGWSMGGPEGGQMVGTWWVGTPGGWVPLPYLLSGSCCGLVSGLSSLGTPIRGGAGVPP